jgi:alkyldihydroxyacetonephosphate synthase
VDTLETATDWRNDAPMVTAIESAIEGALSAQQGDEPVHVFTHLSHLYPQGSSIYTTYLFRMADSYGETLARWKKLKAAASNAVVANRGTISHQHGVGLDHAPYLQAEKGELGIGAIKQLCQYFDPEQRMNSGKLLPHEEDQP